MHAELQAGLTLLCQKQGIKTKSTTNVTIRKWLLLQYTWRDAQSNDLASLQLQWEHLLAGMARPGPPMFANVGIVGNGNQPAFHNAFISPSTHWTQRDHDCATAFDRKWSFAAPEGWYLHNSIGSAEGSIEGSLWGGVAWWLHTPQLHLEPFLGAPKA